MQSLSNHQLINGKLILNKVYAGYGGDAVIENISVSLSSPFFAILMGPNGAGKTTLLRLIVGLLKPLSGDILIYGLNPWKDTGAIRNLVGYVPQMILVHHDVPIKVEEVVAMGLLSRIPPPRRLDGSIRLRVREALKLVGLEGLSSKLFSELSGGQRQRVLIARALIRKPRLLVLDEPCSMLDFRARCEMIKLLQYLHVSKGVDILLTAHDISPCLNIEPTVILINRRIYAVGRLTEVLRPEVLRRAYPGLTEAEGLLILGEDHATHS